jgi:hypothetical protein
MKSLLKLKFEVDWLMVVLSWSIGQLVIWKPFDKL